ncbi:MAG: PD40 domain-containing protein [Planctomycetes bacterium]|nr:PD40 domain-containing protein [Planctomycetota bacterium]
MSVAAASGTTRGVAQGEAFEIRAGKPVAPLPGERHFRNLRQLTFDGENAEAYWANDGRRLILQRKAAGMPADQIYVLDLATGDMQQVSTGTGATTCSYFLQGDRRIIFASTHHHGEAPPPVVKVGRGGYVWAVHKEYDLFTADPDGSNLRQITDTPGYDAEATACPVSGTIVFTSVRDGDLELYTCEPDGSDVRRITNRSGYDGGAFFSHDGSKLVLRSAFPKNAEAAAEDKELLMQALVKPSQMEITVCNRDGSDFHQVTDNGAANFAPFWMPDDQHIIFSSNVGGMAAAKETGDHSLARNFDIFIVDQHGGELEQVTFEPEFDGFPMFSPNGKYIAFSSNRYGKQRGDTNVFVAEWVE